MGMTFDSKMARNGRMVLPKLVREALGLPEGGTVVFSLEDGEVKLTSIQQSVRRAQEIYRQFAKQTFSVDDFIAERRAEAASEEETK